LFALSLLAGAACGDDGTAAETDDGSSGEATTSTSGGTSSATGDSTTSTENQPPPTPVLMTPTDGATEQPTSLDLCWEPVTDPDGDEVRYRVWVNDIELDEGKLSDLPGHEGPCLGPLAFNPGETFEWTVAAFETYNLEHESARATPFAFTTESLTDGAVVFEDPFDEDLGWDVEGDATSGAWIRGNPDPTMDANQLAQPSMCAGGSSCYYTGDNPGGSADDDDVDGGATVLVSPAFDLSGYATASVQFSRFFYKSGDETGTLLSVELLVPDTESPGGYQAFVLEQLEGPDDTVGANAWMPVEHAACGAPMVDGSRLRITAADLGDGITEGAIDSVIVRGYQSEDLCTGGLDAICNPNDADTCADPYVCCGLGTLNKGVYRCMEAVPSLDYDNPPAENAPFNGPMGCPNPDLFVTDQGMELCVDDIYVANNPNNQYYCALLEGCVAGAGNRRIVRFDTITPNRGATDLVMGVPANHPDLFHFSQCHNHYHFDGYATYEMVDGQDNQVATGHKQAFCLLDWNSWAWPGDFFGTYSCSSQGISAGWQDVYGVGLDCQWIDVTDTPDGTYTLRIAVNPPGAQSGVPPLNETDFSNNVLEVPVDLANLPQCN
jgi:hypothetical protein